MSEVSILLIFLAVGFSAGVLIGMLGVGGGVIFVPALYYMLPIYGIDASSIPYFAISISLIAGAIAASFSSVLHFRENNLDIQKALLFAFGSCSAAFISVIFVTSVGPGILKIIFAVVLFIVAVYMLLDVQKRKESSREKELNKYYLPGIGLSVGVLSAFTGLGGGIVFMPVLHYLYLLDAKKAVGTSSLITALTMLFAGLSFFVHQDEWTGNINIGHLTLLVAVPLGIGAIAGARFGFSLVKKLNASSIKKIFAVLLIIVVVKIIFTL